MRKKTRSSRRRGNAMVEFGVAMMLIIPIFAGTFQYGYSFFVYDNLETSVRAAARYAATRTYDAANPTPSTEFKDAVRNMAVYGNPSGGSNPVAPGLTTANVNVLMTFNNGVPFVVTVEVTGYSLDGVFGTITLNGKPRVSFPYLGSWDPVI